MSITLTPSSAPYLDCLKKYHTLQIEKKWPGVKAPSGAIRFGIVIHAILKELYNPTHGTNPPHTDRLDLWMRTAFLRGNYREESDYDHDWQRAEKLIHAYLNDDKDERAYSVLGVEQAGTFPINDKAGEELFRIYARLDQIRVYHDDPSTCVAVDFKVGGRVSGVEIDQTFINLAVAKLSNPGFQRYVLEIQNLSDDGIDRAVYKSSALKGVVSLVAARVRRYHDAEGTFRAEPGECCLYCPLAKTCQGEKPATIVDDLEFSD